MDTDNRMYVDEVNFKKAHRKYKNAMSPSLEELETQRNTEFENNIKFSILLTLNNNEEDVVRAMLNSISKQSYENFEVSILDVTDKAHAFLGNICKDIEDDRFKYTKLKKNYTAFELLKEQKKYINGDYCVFMESSDILSLDALFECARVIGEKDGDFVYSDNAIYEVRTDNVMGYNIKPDFSLYNLEYSNYIRSFIAVKTKIFNILLDSGELGKELTKDDIISILAAISSKVEHIRKPLYKVKKTSKKVTPKKIAPITELPGISVVILNTDNFSGFKATIEAIKELKHSKLEILVVEAETTDINTVRYYKELSQCEDVTVRFFRWKKEKSYSRMINYALSKAVNEYVLVVEPVFEFGENWLKPMLYYILQDGVAMVAPAYIDKKGNMIDSALSYTKNVSRVSLECALIKKSMIEEALSEKDMDYVEYSQLISDKMIEVGYQNVITTKSTAMKKGTIYKKISKGTALEYDPYCEDYYK